MTDLNEHVKNKINEIINSDVDEKISTKVKKANEVLTREDIKEIIKELMPDLDDMIAIKVKEHFNFLINSLTGIFKMED